MRKTVSDLTDPELDQIFLALDRARHLTLQINDPKTIDPNLKTIMEEINHAYDCFYSRSQPAD